MGILRQFNNFDYLITNDWKEFKELKNIYINTHSYRRYFYKNVIFNPRITVYDSGLMQIRYEKREYGTVCDPIPVLALCEYADKINDWDMNKIKKLKDVPGEYRFEEREDFGFWKRIWNKITKKPNTKSWWFIPNGETHLFFKKKTYHYKMIKEWSRIIPLKDL